MTIREFGKCVEYNIEHELKYAILGLGAPGVGKSQVIQQIGRKHGYTVIDLRLAQMSEVEIGGLIYPNKSRTKTVWLSPDILPDEERDGKKTILLLDELTSCTKRVQVAAYQLILDRRIGQYRLPEGTFVVALGNREDDDGVYVHLAGPLADRFEIHYIEPNFQEWKEDFALKAGVHPYVIQYLEFKPAALHNQALDVNCMVFATPRSWVRVSDILRIDQNVRDPVIAHKIIGNIGETEGRQFLSYCSNLQNMTDIDDVLNGKAPLYERPEYLRLYTNALVDRVFYIKDANSLADLTPAQKKQLELILKALLGIPQGEYVTLGLKDLLARNRMVIQETFLEMDDPIVSSFIKNNAFLLGLEE